MKCPRFRLDEQCDAFVRGKQCGHTRVLTIAIYTVVLRLGFDQGARISQFAAINATLHSPRDLLNAFRRIAQTLPQEGALLDSAFVVVPCGFSDAVGTFRGKRNLVFWWSKVEIFGAVLRRCADFGGAHRALDTVVVSRAV